VLIVNGMTSLGLDEEMRQGWLSGRAKRRAVRAALADADLVVFHNPDDPRRLVSDGLLAADHPRLVTPGSGIDLAHFADRPLPSLDGGLSFAMLARLDRSSGALKFAAAADRIKAKAPTTCFVLAGPPGEGPAALSPRHPALAAVEMAGFVDDVRPIIAAAHVVVHMSRSEGLPGAVLEALAMGRPVIAADCPGSRQTVDERVNGVLVPPGDTGALGDAMESFLRRPDLMPAMARASRAKAERLFDVRDVTRTMMAALDLDT
jgi:glycosyltransferase involved in cell wall biosynthesis